MDIYPTCLSLLGVSDYRWKGFGINLLDKNAKRLISEKEAFVLSDKLIRNNYFSE
jgi:hypothetical protein